MSAVEVRPPPSRRRAVLAIARTDLARLVRDPIALFFIVVLPVVIILLIGATFGTQGNHTTIGIVDIDHTAESGALVQSLRDSGVLDVKDYATDDELRQDIRIQNVTGGITIPAGYAASLEQGDTAMVTLLADQKQQSTTTLMRVVNDVLDREGQTMAAARFAAAQDGGEPAAQLERARTVQARLQQVRVEVETTGRASLGSTNRYSYTAPSNLVLFVFINSLTGATALVESRQLGVTRRTLAAPLSIGTIVLGAGTTRLLVALIQSTLILSIGSLVFGVDWGNPPAAAALVLVFALLATGAGLLVGSIATKPEQVPSIGVPVSIGFAMLGGCMWPLEVVTPTLRTVGHLTPHAWAMDAWVKVSFEGGGISAIALDLAVLGTAAVALLALAVWRMRRSLLG
jgi:ABC-2 type transport system permease protein